MKTSIFEWKTPFKAPVLLASLVLASYSFAGGQVCDCGGGQGGGQVCDGIGQPKTFASGTGYSLYGSPATDLSAALAAAGNFKCDDCFVGGPPCPMTSSGGKVFGTGTWWGRKNADSTYDWDIDMTQGGEVVITCSTC